MKTCQLMLLLLCLLSQVTVKAEQTMSPGARPHNLMPVPASVQFASGRLSITNAFRVATTDYADARLSSAINRTMTRLSGRTGITFAPVTKSVDGQAALVIVCAGPGRTIPAVDEDETYQLDVSDRQARLAAPTVVGALRGLETFLQLVSADADGFYLPAVTIRDQPRFKWRGLLIDVARHYQPIEVLKRNLDAMAAVKLNVFHWHLTENQGFRIESKKFPKLHQLGSDGQYYTQEQAREIVSYAAERGIRVVPEFDMPGHSTAWLVGYPELASLPGPYEIERHAGIFDPTLDPTRDEVYKFLDTFIGEMAGLFPDAYLHIGGDENEGKQWDRNPKIQAFMKEKGIKDNHALQAYFNQRMLKILQKHKKKMIGWDEILQPDLPRDVVIQSWRGPAALAEAAKKGYDGILSNGYYIDLMYPASQHYLADPIPANSTLTADETKHILGGEATMWGEFVSPETIDSRIWPRTAAIAERLWSRADVTDIDDMYRRLAAVSIELEELGLTHERNPQVLLRRLAQTKEIGPVETLVSVLTPVKEYRRGQQRPAIMLSPLTGLVDAAQADSETARQFSMRVEALLSDAPHFRTAEVRQVLTGWRNAGPELNLIVERAPALHEARPLADDLSAISTIGLEATSYLTDKVSPTTQWRDASLARLEQAAKPKAALEFVIVPSLRQLVIAASEISSLQQLPPAEWKVRVKTLANPPAK
ncbi:MAG TPA: family 20 glycosylhydrolase [Pyrinomonadaceae bacterium]|nr:family 20 glycosylhydrolase [Pyrinomonadaceae bacterium]